MKQKRHEAIIELVKNNIIQTQEELLDRLRDRGFEVTQATISRDIRVLGLIKIRGAGDSYRYAIASRNDHSSHRFSEGLANSVIKIDSSGNLIVIKTYPGMAGAVATRIDALDLSDIIGCVAGDDAILVVTRGEGAAAELRERLSHII